MGLSHRIGTLLLALVVLGVLISTSEGAKDVSGIMDSMFENYDKRIRPPNNGKSVRIGISSYVLDVFNIDEKNHEFTAQLYFRQHWVDGRLTYNPPAGVKSIPLDPQHAKNMWIPDTFVVNERRSQRHDMTVDNEFTRVKADGEVLRSIRVSVTGSCKMNLKWFPFDRHICSLVFESYGYTSDEFFYEWERGEGGQPKIGISAGAGGTINQQITAIKGYVTNVAMSSGNYSRASIEFLVVRVPTRFLQDVYFPAIILVTIAFITMSVGALQFRVMLSVICMVGIILFTSLLSMEMPKVSYQTAMDFYVFKCSFMIFNVVIVNFIMYHLLKPKPSSVNTRMRMRQLNGTNSTDDHDAKEILPDAEASEDFNIGRPSFDSRFKELVYKLCMYSQYTMPTFFVVFNIIYWPVVLLASNNVGDDMDFMLLEDTQ